MKGKLINIKKMVGFHWFKHATGYFSDRGLAEMHI